MTQARKELEEAHRRIAELEGELRAPLRTAVAPLAVALALVILGSGIAMGWLLVRPSPAAPASTTVAPTTTPPSSSISLRWDSALGREPLFADADGDGVDDLVGLFLDDTRLDRMQWVVALDGRTFAPLWRAGPFPGQAASFDTFLVRTGALVVFTETQGGVHTMDLQSGARRGDLLLAKPAAGVCVAEDGRVSFALGYGPERELLDPRTGVLSDSTNADAPCNARLGPSPRTYCEKGGPRPCLSRAFIRGRGRIDPYLTIEDDSVLLTTGMLPLPPHGDAALARPPPYAVAADPATRRVLWEGVLSLPDEPVQIGGDRWDYAAGIYVVAYRSPSGFHLVARNARTGKVAWSTELAGGRDGSVLYSLVIHRQRVYADINGQVQVYELLDGTFVATVRAA